MKKFVVSAFFALIVASITGCASNNCCDPCGNTRVWKPFWQRSNCCPTSDVVVDSGCSVPAITSNCDSCATGITTVTPGPQ